MLDRIPKRPFSHSERDPVRFKTCTSTQMVAPNLSMAQLLSICYHLRRRSTLRRNREEAWDRESRGDTPLSISSPAGLRHRLRTTRLKRTTLPHDPLKGYRHGSLSTMCLRHSCSFCQLQREQHLLPHLRAVKF